MLLYHGSIDDFDRIDLALSKPYKDFGQGFYATQTRSHAVAIAERNAAIERKRLLVSGRDAGNLAIWLYTYDFPDSSLETLNIKRFERADLEWIQFVSACRTSARTPHGYDIVQGPTANDRTNASIQAYFSGAFGDVGSEGALDILLRVILPDKLPSQTVFVTERAIAPLVRAGKERLPWT